MRETCHPSFNHVTHRERRAGQAALLALAGVHAGQLNPWGNIAIHVNMTSLPNALGVCCRSGPRAVQSPASPTSAGVPSFIRTGSSRLHTASSGKHSPEPWSTGTMGKCTVSLMNALICCSDMLMSCSGGACASASTTSPTQSLASAASVCQASTATRILNTPRYPRSSSTLPW